MLKDDRVWIRLPDAQHEDSAAFHISISGSCFIENEEVLMEQPLFF